MTTNDGKESTFQASSRRFRPKCFSDVIGQQACVRTLINALRKNRLAHAYLFSGPRGTGKTTLARLFAKAINCTSLSPEGEPCNQCRSCKEITQGTSLDVIEIDGASHRGIDDIRSITESVGYSPSSGKFKIYIIDEVHMLTKEAFNALLKTLEEPPSTAKFFFATTEPHKIPQTILSRCQRYNVQRLSKNQITSKLLSIASELGVLIDDKALLRLSEYAEGGLRDAESLFDQLIAFADEKITEEMVEEVLGLVPFSLFSKLDIAYREHDLRTAIDISTAIFTSGKDIAYFLDDLTNHYRYLLYFLIGSQDLLKDLPDEYKAHLKKSASWYNQESCLSILDLIIKAHETLKGPTLARYALEALLLDIIQIRLKVPHAALTQALIQLKSQIDGLIQENNNSQAVEPEPSSINSEKNKGIFLSQKNEESLESEAQEVKHEQADNQIKTDEPKLVQRAPAQEPLIQASPITTPAEKKIESKRKEPSQPKASPQLGTQSSIQDIENLSESKQRIREENLMQFSSIELEGQLIKPQTKQP